MHDRAAAAMTAKTISFVLIGVLLSTIIDSTTGAKKARRSGLHPTFVLYVLFLSPSYQCCSSLWL